MASDFRLPGGTSAAVAAELKGASGGGLACAVLPVKSSILHQPRLFNERVSTAARAAGAAWLLPDTEAVCDVLIVHNPLVFLHLPTQPIRIEPKAVVCVVQHPPFAGDGAANYDPHRVLRNLKILFQCPVLFAPVGPHVRRQHQRDELSDIPLLSFDLHNLIDLDDWPARSRPPPQNEIVIGRHARPDSLKWPDSGADILAAYPEHPRVKVKILGGPPPADILAELPSNWQILQFSTNAAQEFLRTLDVYVYFHSRRWVEGFGLAVLEAMAVGLVVVVPRSFAELFGEGAMYAAPGEVLPVLERLLANPAEYKEQSHRARSVAEARFSVAQYADRYAKLLDELGLAPTERASGDPLQEHRKVDLTIASRETRRTILFMSSNGVGLGHLTRQLAIATRLPTDLRPAFLTMSQGAELVRRFDFPVDYVPSHQRLGLDLQSWSNAISHHIADALDLFRPDVVVFDGNVPYQGLLDVIETAPEPYWVWIRRAMWREGQLEEILNRSDAFDAVLEPGEIAADEDIGPTRRNGSGVLPIPPVLLVEPADRLPREVAAEQIGCDPHRVTVALQLGSGANFDYARIRTAILEYLGSLPDIQVLEFESILRTPGAECAPAPLRRVQFPSFAVSSAVDVMITGAGYNSFHECLFGSIPAVFIPNEAPELDDQLLRARFAATAGMALCLRGSEVDRVPAVLSTALHADIRRSMKKRMASLRFENGAQTAVALLTQLASSIRADRPLAANINRL